MWLGGALLLLALLVFLGRDLPRQLVERQIGATLGGETHLEALEWPGEGIFLLKGLEVASPSFSAALRRLEIDEIEVAATWEQLRRGQVGSLTLRGLRAELDPSRPLLAAGEGPEAPFHSLAVASGAQVLVVSRAGQALASATFTASFTNAPGFPGEITATITGLDLSDFETLMPLELPEPLRRQLAGLELGEIELKGSSGEGGFELEAKAKPWRQAAFHLRGSSLSGRLEGLELAALAPTSALLAASGQLDLSLSGSLAAAELELALSPARFRFGQDAFELGPTRLRGRYHREQAAHHLTVTSFASELLAASMLPAEAGPALPLDLKFAGELDLTAQQATIKGQIESQALGVFPFAGEVAASEGLDLAVTTPQLRISQLLELLPTKPGLPKAAEVAGSAAAKLEIRGPLAAPRVRAELELAGLAPAPGLTDLAGTASLIWSAQAAALVGCQRFSARAKVAPPLAGMAIVELDVRGAGQIDIDRRRLLLRDLELRTAKLGQLAGEIEAEFPAEADLADASVKARFEIREVALENWLAEAQNTGLPAGMSFSGKFTALPALQKASGGPWELTGSWKLEGAGFASAAGDRVLEGLTLTGDLAASLAAAATPGAAYTLG